MNLFIEIVSFIIRFSTGILLRMWFLWLPFAFWIGDDSTLPLLIAFFPIYLGISLLSFIGLYWISQLLMRLIRKQISQKLLLHICALLNTLVVFASFKAFNIFQEKWEDLTYEGKTLIFSAITVHLVIFLTYQMNWAEKQINRIENLMSQYSTQIEALENKINQIGK